MHASGASAPFSARTASMYPSAAFTLGSTRFEKNTTAPFVRMRISDHEFDHVRADPAPEMAERGAAAMAAKYWSDLLIRFARHPLTVRLNVPPP
jgi:hypothetical protein